MSLGVIAVLDYYCRGVINYIGLVIEHRVTADETQILQIPLHVPAAL